MGTVRTAEETTRAMARVNRSVSPRTTEPAGLRQDASVLRVSAWLAQSDDVGPILYNETSQARLSAASETGCLCFHTSARSAQVGPRDFFSPFESKIMKLVEKVEHILLFCHTLFGLKLCTRWFFSEAFFLFRRVAAGCQWRGARHLCN